MGLPKDTGSSHYNQERHAVRCEWGNHGLALLAAISDVVIIVDVLSFCTSVSIATNRGALVYPFSGADPTGFANGINAELAWFGNRYSLSPSSLQSIEAGTRLVLPSPNGSRLSTSTGNTTTLAGCLRNAAGVAAYARWIGGSVAVIPAGERWRGDDSLRPALEDWLGAGAIIHALGIDPSPEAAAAEAAYLAARSQLEATLAGSSSGRESRARGREEDVVLAAQLNADETVPLLQNSAYRAISATSNWGTSETCLQNPSTD